MTKIPNKSKKHPVCVNLYAIRDVKQPRFFQLFEAPNHEVAKRQFAQMMVHDGNTPIASIADFELWHLADYDHTDGQIDPLESPEFLIGGLEAYSAVKSTVDNLYANDRIKSVSISD